MNTLAEIEIKFLSLSNDKNNALKHYEEYAKFYDEECNRENIDYNNLFEIIKEINLYKLYTTKNRENVTRSRLEFIKDEIMKIEHSKLHKNNYELEMYRRKESLDNINKEYDITFDLRNEIIEKERLLEDADIRQKCNICENKKDNFISCNKCYVPLCVECYDKILNMEIISKCPYCRHIIGNNNI